MGRKKEKKITTIIEHFGGTITYSNRGMRHRDEEETFHLKKGDVVIFVRED